MGSAHGDSQERPRLSRRLAATGPNPPWQKRIDAVQNETVASIA